MLRAALRFAFLFLPALLAGLPEPPCAHASAGHAQVAPAQHTQPLAFDVALPAPTGFARSDSGAPPLWFGPGHRRAGSAAVSVARVADVRARAVARAHLDFAGLRLAERSNRYVFGSTAPPPLL